MLTKENLDNIKKAISEGKKLTSDSDHLNSPECHAWKLKCLYILKRLNALGIPDANVQGDDCPSVIALAQLEIACSSAANWLTKQQSVTKTEKRQEKIILCLHCGNKTKMEKVTCYTHEWRDYANDIWTETTWNLYFCPVCSNVTLENLYIFSEDYCIDEFGDQSLAKNLTTLYPHPPSTSELGIPINIKKSFEAAQKVRHIDGAICALSLRRTLEMICKDKGQNEGNLFIKLRNLSQQGILPTILDQMATVLRQLGNVAAHADDTENEFPSELVPDLIEFTDTILNYLYILPARIQDIQNKMNNEGTSLPQVSNPPTDPPFPTIDTE